MADLILIADALDEYRRKLHKELEHAFPGVRIKDVSVIGDLVDALNTRKPAALLLDEALVNEQESMTISDLKELSPNTHLVLLTIYDDEQIDRAASRAGIDAVVNKFDRTEVLFPLLRSFLEEA